jgi:outer membrane protein assembly factor BamA
MGFPISSLVGQNLFVPAQVRFSGLKRTKLAIVRRELAFQPGIPIFLEDTSLIFKKSAANIFNTRLFNFCRYSVDSIWTDSLGRTTGRVVFQVNERWYTFPSPIFELADRNFNEWWYDRNADIRRVNVGLRFVQKNVRGRNEDLILNFQEGFTRRFEAGYVIPYLDKKQIFGLRFVAGLANNKDVAFKSVGNRLEYKRDENTFGRERFYTSLELSARRSIYQYHFFQLGYKYNRLSDFTFAQNPAYFLGKTFQRYGEIRYSFVADRRNFRNFGTKGYWFSLLASRFGILPQDNFRIWIARLAYARYFDLGSGFFLASKADVEWSNRQAQPYLGTRVLGFDNRFVRGYERYVVEGYFNMHSRNSLRYRFWSTKFQWNWIPVRQFRFVPVDAYITPFIDAGYVANPFIAPENKRLVQTALLGYGVGLNLVTFYDVVFRVEYSLTRHGDQGLYLSFLTDI